MTDPVPVAPAPSVPAPREKAAGKPLVWEIDVPLLTNPLILVAMMKVFALAGLLMWSLLAFLFAMQGEWDALGPMALLSAGAAFGVLTIGLLATALIFRNRLRFRFALDDTGAAVTRVDRRARVTDALAIGLGTLAGKPGAVGAGLLSSAQSEVSVAWTSVARLVRHPRQQAVALANVWRTTAVIYCPPKRYEEIASRIEAAVARSPRPTRANPVPGLLLRTVGVVIAAIPLFNLPVKIDVFAPFLVLCFALASVWLLPVLAWVVIGGLGFVAFDAFMAATKPFKSWLSGEMITPWSIFGTDDHVTIGLALAGTAWLLWLCRGLLTGRISSGLFADMVEMGDD